MRGSEATNTPNIYHQQFPHSRFVSLTSINAVTPLCGRCEVGVLCHHLHDPSWWQVALLFSSFVSISLALCRPLHGPSCSLEPPVLFYDFDSTSTHFFLNSTCVSYRSPRHLYAPNLPLLHYPSTKAFVTPRATSPYMHPDSDRQFQSCHPVLFFRHSIQSHSPHSIPLKPFLECTTHTSKFLQHTSFNRTTFSTPP